MTIMKVFILYLIAFIQDDEMDDDRPAECMLTMISQLNPKGWIWKKFGFQHNYLQQVIESYY